MVCKNCGKELYGRFCEHCGRDSQLDAAPGRSVYCIMCGTKLRDRFCHKCGHDSFADPPLEPSVTEPEKPTPAPEPASTPAESDPAAETTAIADAPPDGE